MSTADLTLMAVHAHPDDEASTTGGVLARYADEGVRTVVVTCTDGELGDGEGASKPGEAGHDETWVVATRRRELETSCNILRVSALETLGYRDSGMMGWPQNDAEGSFWTTPVDEAAGRLSELIDKYRPQVVVTYDENGFYGHPDHIQANRVTVAALEATGAVDKLYYPVVGASSLARFRELIVEAGVQSVPEASEDWDFAVADELVTTSVDCADYLSQQFSALAAHASQDDGTFFLRLGVDLFSRLMNPMTFTRVFDRTGSPIPEDDLFVGLR